MGWIDGKGSARRCGDAAGTDLTLAAAGGTDLTLVSAGAGVVGLGAREADAVLPFVAVEAEAVGLAADEDEAAGAVLSFVGCQ